MIGTSCVCSTSLAVVCTPVVPVAGVGVLSCPEINYELDSRASLECSQDSAIPWHTTRHTRVSRFASELRELPMTLWTPSAPRPHLWYYFFRHSTQVYQLAPIGAAVPFPTLWLE